MTLAAIAVVTAIVGVISYIQKPQFNLEKRVDALESDMTNIKQTHSESDTALKLELKELTVAVNELGKTVVKLSTIIDERIPKGSPNLTPPGQ